MGSLLKEPRLGAPRLILRSKFSFFVLRAALAAAVLIAAAASVSGCGGVKKYQAEFYGLFDTLTTIIGYAGSQKEFDGWAGIIYDEMSRLNKLYDIYNAYDGINNLRTVNQNAGTAPVKVEPEIIGLLSRAVSAYEETGGAVNAAMGSVLKIWHDYREGGVSLPPAEALEEANRRVDISGLVIDERAGTVFLKTPGMSLDVGAVAKAYAAGLAAGKARAAGMESAIISAGGNITAIGKPLDGTRARWGVGIQDPDLAPDGAANIVDTVYVNDFTVSSSGGYQRYYTVGGKDYCHIIDPATLMPADRFKAVAVIHKDPAAADILSTAIFILPFEEGMALVSRLGGEALWIGKDGALSATDGYVKVSKNLGNYSAAD
jgi:thiamine biosynthesis lipoprotein